MTDIELPLFQNTGLDDRLSTGHLSDRISPGGYNDCWLGPGQE